MNENNNNVQTNSDLIWKTATPSWFIKHVVIFFLLLVAGIAMAIGGLVLLGETVFGGVALIALGAFFIWIFGTGFIGSIKNIKDRLEEDKKNGEKALKNKITAAIAVLIVVCIIGSIGGIIGYGMYEARGVNYRVRTMLDTEINENCFDEIEEYRESLARENAFVRKFVSNKAAVEEYMNKANEFADIRATEIEKEIAAIKPCKKLKSYEEYSERYDLLYNLTLNENDNYETWIKKNVENYAELEKYIEDFEKLLKSYEEGCTTCGGDGKVACGLCGGRGSRQVYHTTPNGKTWLVHQECAVSKTCGTCGGDGIKYTFE